MADNLKVSTDVEELVWALMRIGHILDNTRLKSIKLLRAQKIVNSVVQVRPGKYYSIIGSHIEEPVGKCYDSGVCDVITEEPGSMFVQISEEEFNREEE